MYRFQVRLQVTIELDAEDKQEASEIVRDWADAVEEGDGCYVQELARRYVERCRIVPGSAEQQYPVCCGRIEHP